MKFILALLLAAPLAGQTVCLSGDFTGCGTTTIPTVLVNTGVTAGTYGDASHVPQVTFDAKGRAVSVTSMVISGGGSASVPAAPTSGNLTPLTYNNNGVLGNATPNIVQAALATPQATQITGSIGQAAYAGVVPATPSAGNSSFVVCFNSTTGAATLDANGLAQWCVLKSDGSQTVIAGPSPPLTWNAINAVYVASPNCAISGHTDAAWLSTGSCTLPPGLPPSIASTPVGAGNSGGTTVASPAVTNVAGNLNIVVLSWGGYTAPTGLVNGTGVSGVLIGSKNDSPGGGNGQHSMAAYAFPNVASGTATYTATWAAGTNASIAVYPFQSAAASSATESFIGSGTSGYSGSCGTVTTTAGNETIMAVGEVPYGTVTFTGMTAISGAPMNSATTTLTNAGTFTANYSASQGDYAVCIAFAIHHN